LRLYMGDESARQGFIEQKLSFTRPDFRGIPVACALRAGGKCTLPSPDGLRESCDGFCPAK
jgi:hypothetical protein